jgi:lysophospholipase L1-like esterase
MIFKAVKTTAVNLVVFLLLLLLLEASLQAIALIRPSYDVLFMQPDKILGWKQVPDHHWTWAGHNWYASDFSVNVETNGLGFRDLERDFTKPHGVTRVALLGDSFIEAVQVPFEKTAGQLLERALIAASAHSRKWEVLNFGISNYGVGQYLLTWEQYAKHYEPDYVAIFVARFIMRRTVSKYEYGAFSASQKNRLWIRPTFRLENDELIREPARDFDEFVTAQEDLMNSEFAGRRARRKKGVITLHYAREFKDRVSEIKDRFSRLARGSARRPKTIRAPVDAEAEAELFSINIKIIEELGRKVAGAGGKLLVLDASRYFGDRETVSVALKEVCSRNHLGYLPVYEHLLKANRDGISTRWAGDGHFNEAGNEVLAKALLGWIGQHSPRPPRGVDSGGPG